jgi:hypothetical protein
MKLDCADLERVLREDDPEAMAAIAVHAEGCEACREQLRQWSEISAAAATLHRSWESPRLWTRIEAALEDESRRRPVGALHALGRHWLAAAATLTIAVLGVSAARLLLRESESARSTSSEAEMKLLTERALGDVEAAEAAYVRSIDALARLAAPRLQAADSPLLMSYREKLVLIDAAIAECRAQIERNRFNAHLRQELLAIYQEKQRTLQQLAGETRS